MSKIRTKSIIVFILGMLTFASGAFFVNTFFLVERPVKDGIIEDWGQVCFWQDMDGIYVAISPKGCYSSSCTRIKQQTGAAIVDLQNQEIQLDARFVLLETSRFPLPCTNDCYGGGSVQFKLEHLIPNDYAVRFKDQWIGGVKVFSGNPTPRQCFENGTE